jgi:dolichol-phosphate mannosyltransferase
MTSVWVVLPTYNERENLPIVLTLIHATLANCDPPVAGTVLVVDDASPDGTGEVADQLAREHDSVRVLHRTRKGGLGGAYLAGFGAALAGGADLVVEMDADLSHNPADLPRLIDAARHGADVVLGSRYLPGGGVEGWSLHRRLLSRAGGCYAATVLGLPLSDLTGGFKCFRASALRAVDGDLVHSRGYAFQIELTFHAARAGLEIAEVPIVFRERERGRSKMSPAIALEAIWRVPFMRLGALGELSGSGQGRLSRLSDGGGSPSTP